MLSPIASAATSFTDIWSGRQLMYRGSTTYSPRDIQMMAIMEGLRTIMDTHEKRKAGRGPNASMM